MIQKYSTIISFFIFFIIHSCRNKEQRFIFNIENNKSVKLILLNNKEYIKYDEVVPVKFIINGIKLNQLRIIAPGIRIFGRNNNILDGHILVKRNYLKSFPKFIREDTLHINVYEVENNRIKNKGEILVPLKI